MKMDIMNGNRHCELKQTLLKKMDVVKENGHYE